MAFTTYRTRRETSHSERIAGRTRVSRGWQAYLYHSAFHQPPPRSTRLDSTRLDPDEDVNPPPESTQKLYLFVREARHARKRSQRTFPAEDATGSSQDPFTPLSLKRQATYCTFRLPATWIDILHIDTRTCSSPGFEPHGRWIFQIKGRVLDSRPLDRFCLQLYPACRFWKVFLVQF